MQENKLEENTSSQKLQKRRKNKTYLEDISKKHSQNKTKKNIGDKNNNILKTEKQLEIQKKLKHIFNEVRAKGKYEYNKQEIPEHLKYHSDSDSSELSKNTKDNNSKKYKTSKIIKNNNNLSTNLKKTNKIKDNNNIITKDFEVTEKPIDIINREKILKKEKKFNNVRDIIEKLKIKKNEKEDLARLEKEAEEQSIIRGKINKNMEDDGYEEKINESEIEQEAEKIRKKEKRMEDRRIAREKRRKMEEEEKRKKEKEFEERKRKEKEIKNRKNSDEKDEENIDKKENKIYISNKKKIKYNNMKKLNEINEENKKVKDKNINNNIKNKLDSIVTYKKPNQKSFINDKIYRPKKAIGSIKGRSQEKIGNIINQKKLNENKFCKSPNLTYSKKRSMDGLRENNFFVLNKSFGDFRPTLEKENNNFLNGIYNINTLDITSLPDLNSSFDSRLLNINNNIHFNLNNNDFYKRTAQKNYNNSSTNSGNITNSSNRFSNLTNMNNLLNLNGISYINGENDFINMSNNNFNNNNSFFDLLQPQISPYDFNSSYSIGYSNPMANFSYNNNKVNLSNLLNNNYIGINNLNNSLNMNEILSKKNSSIHIEDLLILEEKLNDISNALNTTKIMQNECFDFWNFYFNCSLNGCLEKIFNNLLDANNSKISIKYILISLLICYDCSFDEDILNNVYSILKDLLNLNHKNLILIYEHILSKISIDNKDNIWVSKLLTLVNSSKNNDFNYNYNFNQYDNAINEYSMTLIEKINFNTGIIIQNVRVLLKNYKTPKVEYLTSLFKKINEKSYEEINTFYQQFILRVVNFSGSILASVIFKQNPNFNFNSETSPYIHSINKKKYTLILDLGETLVHFKVNPENEGEGILKVRPWVTEFLDEVVKYYELIIFTGATEDYANLLIDAIDENKSYFAHRLYRQHMIIIDNEFVKDLTRIGRPLDKIIIVDNMPQNFRLQKENGINIRSFWGEDIYDTALNNLSPILVKIAKEGGDIRIELEKYRDEILEKVSSNLSKRES